MKTKTLSQKISGKIAEYAVLSLLVGSQAFAQGGGHVGGGGEDVAFKAIRNELQIWIQKNADIAALTPKLELAGISDSLLNRKFQAAVKAVGERIIFNHDEILFGSNVRICKNDRQIMQITCNIDEWNQTQGDVRYAVVFHEYLGIAGIETNTAQYYSQYPISPKILSFVKMRRSFELGMDSGGQSMPDIEKLGFVCQSSDVVFRRSGKAKSLIVKPDGRFWYYQFTFHMIELNGWQGFQLIVDDLAVLNSGKLTYEASAGKFAAHAGELMGSYYDFSFTGSVPKWFINQQISEDNPNDSVVDSTFNATIYTNDIRRKKQTTQDIFSYDDLDASNQQMICSQSGSQITLAMDKIVLKLLSEKTANTISPFTKTN